MPPSLHPDFSGTPGTFSIIVAPSEFILEALSTLLNRSRNRILYICGNYPEILPKIKEEHKKLQARRALTAYQILSILDDTHESLILFEHDRTLYDDNTDLISTIGEMFSYKAGEGKTVILFATRFDRWLFKLDPYGNRVVYYLESHHPVQKSPTPPNQNQMTLDTIW
ncbi:MAG: hypothetical protein LUQ50_10670 [Methanospirillum sp.]|uniref:hypothetical protein n=1 Tax=Methanospirillum sp. TaxID=45200 RepID=UPI00236AA14C|nr:hypothetical protein [Methanospirillum sp.]MDD1729518.1 hypothetical protein [Methanospirillum sp.]